jgi:hypothetical protein
LCLWTSGAIVERFRFCDAKISLPRVKNRLLTRWGLYQPKGLRYGTESLVQNVMTEGGIIHRDCYRFSRRSSGGFR